MQLRGNITTTRGAMPGTVAIRDTAPGFYVRSIFRRPKLHDTRSAQVGHIAAMMANGWRETLTQAQRDAWETYSAAHAMKNHQGRTITGNGWLWFNRINRSRMTALIGLGTISAPDPAEMTTTPPPTLNDWQAPLDEWTTLSPGVITYRFDNSADWTTDPDAVAIVLHTGPASPAVNVRKSYGRVVQVHQGTSPDGHPFTYQETSPFPASMAGGTLVTYVAWIG